MSRLCLCPEICRGGTEVGGCIPRRKYSMIFLVAPMMWSPHRRAPSLVTPLPSARAEATCSIVLAAYATAWAIAGMAIPLRLDRVVRSDQRHPQEGNLPAGISPRRVHAAGTPAQSCTMHRCRDPPVWPLSEPVAASIGRRRRFVSVLWSCARLKRRGHLVMGRAGAVVDLARGEGTGPWFKCSQHLLGRF